MMKSSRCSLAVRGPVARAHSLAVLAPSRSRRPRPRGAAGRVFDSPDVQIPMRDGVRLHTRIFTPQGRHRPAAPSC